MKTIWAIDPGTEESAWVLFDGERPIAHGKEPNHTVLSRVLYPVGMGGANFATVDALVVERVASYGKPVGQEVFDTVHFTGRIFEAWRHTAPAKPTVLMDPHLVFRRDVKKHLCEKSTGVNDAMVRQALLDRFGPGKEKAIGKKASPGPLYGIKADVWQALALAVTWWDLNAVVKV